MKSVFGQKDNAVLNQWFQKAAMLQDVEAFLNRFEQHYIGK